MSGSAASSSASNDNNSKEFLVLSDSDDDDVYLNPIARKKTTRKPLTNTRSPVEVITHKRLSDINLELDSDSDMELADDSEREAGFLRNKIAKQAKRARDEVARKRERDMKAINNTVLADALPGAKPGNFFCAPALEESGAQVKEMMEMIRAGSGLTSSDSPVANSPISQSDKRRLSFEEKANVSLFVTNLDAPSERARMRVWKLTRPLGELRVLLSEEWHCDLREVNLILGETNVPVEDEETPTSLGCEAGNMLTISSFRLERPVVQLSPPPLVELTDLSPPRVVESTTPPVVDLEDNTGKIKIKCQHLTSKRPLTVVAGMNMKFSDIKELIRVKMELDVVEKIVFENDTIDDDSTPADMDMEDDDCVDVY